METLFGGYFKWNAGFGSAVSVLAAEPVEDIPLMEDPKEQEGEKTEPETTPEDEQTEIPEVPEEDQVTEPEEDAEEEEIPKNDQSEPEEQPMDEPEDVEVPEAVEEILPRAAEEDRANAASADAPSTESSGHWQGSRVWKPGVGIVESYDYYIKNGKRVLGFQEIDGKTFYFKETGNDKTKGMLLTGWQTIRGKTYYFQKSRRSR